MGRWRIKQLINRNDLCRGNTCIEVVQRLEKMVIEKEDMNVADECNDALRSPRPPSGCSDSAGPVAKLNQMYQCACYLKKSGEPPHQISAVLPVLQKGQ